MAKLEIEVDFEALGEELAKHDYVEVVRCKYCENRRYSDFNNGYFCDTLGVIVEDDFFCKDGERRNDEAITERKDS